YRRIFEFVSRLSCQFKNCRSSQPDTQSDSRKEQYRKNQSKFTTFGKIPEPVYFFCQRFRRILPEYLRPHSGNDEQRYKTRKNQARQQEIIFLTECIQELIYI